MLSIFTWKVPILSHSKQGTLFRVALFWPLQHYFLSHPGAPIQFFCLAYLERQYTFPLWEQKRGGGSYWCFVLCIGFLPSAFFLWQPPAVSFSSRPSRGGGKISANHLTSHTIRTRISSFVASSCSVLHLGIIALQMNDPQKLWAVWIFKLASSYLDEFKTPVGQHTLVWDARFCETLKQIHLKVCKIYSIQTTHNARLWLSSR